jgi:hypothetical protein
MTNAALAGQGGLALLPRRKAATDEPAVPALDRRAPPRLTMRRRARERSGDGNAEYEPGAPSRFVIWHRVNFHASIRVIRPLRLGKRHAMMARPGLPVMAGRSPMLDEVLVRIFGRRSRERADDERDRENNRSFAEHSCLPCFWRGDAALTRVKNSAIGDTFPRLRVRVRAARAVKFT